MPSQNRKRISSARLGRRKCVVIGGGLAGLAAAYWLSQCGWEVEVFEAHARLGGRVYSHHFAGFGPYRHLVCELGGEWIGSDHCAMQRLAEEFGLELINHQFSYSFSAANRKAIKVYKPGEWPFEARLEAKFEEFSVKFKKMTVREQKKLDRADWWNFLQTLGFGQRDLRNRDLMDSTDFGESIRQTSAFVGATEYIEGNASDEMDFKIAGGNSRLVRKLAGAIGRRHIHRNSPVKSVRQKGQRVWVGFGGKREVEADACICAIPASHLHTIAWDADYPPEKRAAALQLQYARITKTAVLCKKRFWSKREVPERSGFSVFTNRVSDYCFDSTYLQEPPGGILCSYAIGDKADDISDERKLRLVGQWIARDVAESLGKNPSSGARQVLAVKMQPWQRQDWIGGAYAFYRPGQWFTVRPTLAEAFRNVQFAGEHLAEEQGFMEGAVVSGQEAAANL